MKKRFEKACGTALKGTFKVVNPIKKSIINTHCKVHIFIQAKALEILKNEGHIEEYKFFKEYIESINTGLVWADQDFKSYNHFYNPIIERGKFGHDDNALTLSKKYYERAKKYFAMGNYDRSMFYFGAACHLIQDLTIPHHAQGKLLDGHKQFETYIKVNHNKIKRFTATKGIVKLSRIEEYAYNNAQIAINLDIMYKSVTPVNTKFYLWGTKCLPLAQRSSAGCMLMFYKDLFN